MRKKPDVPAANKLKIKLGDLFMTREAWARLSTVPKKPANAFTIARYIKNVINENLALIQEQRNEYIKLHSTAGDGEVPSIDAEKFPKKIEAFIKEFDAYLSTEIEIDRLDITIDELVKGMSASHGAVIDESALMALEPFFKESK